MTEREWNSGFEPVIDRNCRVLILGSFPSVKSREIGFYYGNKRNRFWDTIEKAVNEKVPDNTEDKKQYLLKHKIALWDVIEKSNIKGSMDADIKSNSSKVAPVSALIEKYNNLILIICNGKKAWEVFNKACKQIKVKAICLPSTSPANVVFSQAEWIKTLQDVL